MKNVGLELGTIRTPDRFWAEYGSGISVGVQAGSPISSPYRMKNERNCQSNIVSVNLETSFPIPSDRIQVPI